MADRKRVLLFAASILIATTGCCVTISSASAAPAKRNAIAQTKFNSYLDEVWVRITRTWELTTNKTGDFKPVELSFNIDRKGNISELMVETDSARTSIKNRLVQAIENCAPFPPLPAKNKGPLKVLCSAQSVGGVLALDVQLPEINIANRIPTADDADPTKDLIRDLQSTTVEKKLKALEDLTALGVKAAPAMLQIFDTTKDADRSVRYRAWEALQAIGLPAKAILPVLIKCLASADDLTRREAILVIAAIGADAEEAGPTLVEALDDRDSSVQKNAALALRKLGPAMSSRAIETLMKAFKEYITFVPDILAEFGAEAVPYLVAGIENGDDYTRIHSVETILKMGPVAAQAAPALIRLVTEHVGGETENRAIEALGNLGAKAKDAVPILMATAQSGTVDTKWRSVEALGDIGPEAKPAIPTLQSCQNSDDPDIRRRAKDAVRKIQAH